METQNNTVTLDEIIDNFGSLQDLRREISQWFCHFVGSSDFADMDSHYRNAITFQFTQLLEYFNDACVSKNQNQPA